MEGAILLGLAGVGYLMNKDSKSHRIETNVKPQVFQNSNSSIYDLNNVKDAQAMEAQMIQDNFQQTLSNGSTMVSDFNAKDKEVVPQSDILMGLDGNPIDKNNFLVNDQGIKVEPFFSGEGPPAVNFNDTRMLNQHQGGFQSEFYQNKTEVNLNLPPQMNVGNVFGMSDTGPAVEQDRYIPGMYKTDELPFERERVAHIDQKSGVNRDIGEIFAQRNSVDNIRALSNQKVSFGGKVLAGKGVDHRSVEGQVYKHLPDQDYENTADRWLVTTGAIDGGLVRPAEILPETNRQYLNRQDLGTPGSSINSSEQKRPMFKESDKQQLASDTTRNLFGKEVFVDDDHNQGSYKVYANEREVTSERTHQGLAGFSIPKEQVYNQDGARTSKKETVLFEYKGGSSSTTLQGMSQDQYFRADLNPNKEIIAQGRAPTTESTKLTNGMDTINLDIKKIESDYFTHHMTGVDRVYQEIPTDQPCEYTRDKDTLDNDKIAYRIEGDLLDPFKHNPYTHSLHSFAY